MNSLIALTSNDIVSWMGTMWWPFVRFSALLWAMPVFENPAVTPRARIAVAMMLAFLVAGQLPLAPAVDIFSLDAVVLTVEQIIFGVLMGLALRLLFEVMSLVGLVLSMQMGLSMALVMDPGSGNQVALLGQLFWIMAALLFFAADGHLITLHVMVESFTVWPIGSSIYNLDIMAVVNLFAWLLASTLLLALPGVIAMMLVNLTFGVASRAAPSLNIFVLGFPMALIMGFFCVFMTLSYTGNAFANLTYHVLTVFKTAMGG
ncbi:MULTISPECIES: flagellar biosynthetic protein FliR [unclassified Pseudoalteromonas]|uniref:flagellar biosynthetic protein FliR n=2 Tax=Pseudoalteromonas TaxID=53246 RepID=UPI001022BAAD|nr:flagellar biosynthetic protein FliR [Pseudoalteromonas sp. L1]RZF92272.1 flagellar biosynthetic protein FliR [Pseudoalteromonas sp. CO302Y]RZG08507.1 flagellar biosynthetic protein FliR [Pseudoalteromonas sp. CO133X]